MAKKREFKKTRKQLDKEAKKELVKASGTRDPPFRNRQRTLLFSSRGIPYRFRHLMRDLASIMPHGKTDVKLDTRNTLSVINEICEMKSCNNCVFFEVRGKRDLYMWVSKAPLGPSIKFFVTNVHTTDELKMTGNCLKGSRYVLSFDDAFDKEPHLELIREVLTQSFGVPKGHPKSKPFVDHIMSFHYIDGRIWVRHFQIATPEAAAAAAAASGSNASAAAAAAGAAGSQALVEIGPRFVLQVVKVFSGSFQGGTLYKNGEFETPSAMRRLAKRAKGDRYASRVEANENRVARKKENVLPAGEIDDVFDAQKDSSEDDDDDDDDDDVAEEDGSDGSGSGDESEDGMDDEDDDDDDASDGSGEEESSS